MDRGFWIANLIMASWWAFIQLIVEIQKVATGADPTKFPLGIWSLNPLEELFEGFVAVTFGLLLYSFGHTWIKKTPAPLISRVVVSGICYALLVVRLGEILHAHCGVADVKVFEIVSQCLLR